MPFEVYFQSESISLNVPIIFTEQVINEMIFRRNHFQKFYFTTRLSYSLNYAAVNRSVNVNLGRAFCFPTLGTSKFPPSANFNRDKKILGSHVENICRAEISGRERAKKQRVEVKNNRPKE